MVFTIKINCKWFLLKKCIANDFYNKNALQIILLLKYIGNGFYYKN